MRPPDEIKHNLVAQWLRKAEEDFQVIAFLMDNSAPFYTAVAFHAQQATEKYLKAWLTEAGIEFTKTHNISYLLSLVAGGAPLLAGQMENAEILSRYAVEYRYPADLPEIGEKEAREAWAIVQSVRECILNALKKSTGGKIDRCP